MEIGAKIKEARTRTGLTQEQAAEALGVSRKTISNWENEKTYPDIVSVVKMSDLYAVSLDRLLKDGEGGSEYLDYLGDSTDTVRSRRRLSILVLLTAYLCVWGLAVIVFWFFTTGSDAMGFSLIYLWLLLPAITVLSVLGSYATNKNMVDVYVAVVFGIIGYLMRKYGIPPAPVVLALILGPMADKHLYQMLRMVKDQSVLSYMFSRPLSIAFMILIVAAVFAPIISRIISKKYQSKYGKMEDAAEDV